MGLNKKEKLYIEQLLAGMDKSLRNKGYKLYVEGGCSFIEHHADTDEYEFSVTGNMTPQYEVFICLEESGSDMWFVDDLYSCDCLYFEENLECKHVAAALYHLAVSHTDLKSPAALASQQGSAKKKGEPVIILCDPNDPQDILGKIKPQHDLPDFYPHLNNVELGKERLTYYLSNGYLDYKLQVEASQDRLTFTANSRGYAVLDSLLGWFYRRVVKQPRELRFLTKAGRESELLAVLDYYQIPAEKVKLNEDLKIVFAQDNFHIVPQGKLEGLYHPENFVNVLEKELIQKNRDWMTGRYLEDESHAEQGKYNVGFVLHWNPYGHRLESIRPIMGKGSKHQPNALKVKLDWISSPYSSLLSPNPDLPEILFKVKNINDLLPVSKVESQRLLLHQLILQFLEGHSEYPFYLSSGYVHAQYKPRMMDLNQVLVCRGSLAFQMHQEDFSYLLQPVVEVDEQRYFLKDIRDKSVLLDHFLILDQRQLVLFSSPKEVAALKSFWDYPLVRYTDAQKAQMEQSLIQPLAVDYPFHFEPGMIMLKEIATPPVRQLYISELSQFVVFRPVLSYGESLQINPLETGSLIDFDSNTQIVRDLEQEQAYIQEIRALHEQFHHQGNQGFFYLSFDQFVQDLWFLKTFESLKQEGVEVFGLNELKNLRFSPYPAKVAFKLDSKQDWFEANMEVAFGDNKVKLKDIKKAIDSGGNYIELSDGSLGILPENWLRKFGRLFRSGQQEKESLRIAKTHFNLIDEVADQQGHKKILEEIAEQKKKLASFTKIEDTPPPAQLQAELRQYQLQGLNWLNFLREFGWGGILADDMGLGKTLQAIALICQIMEQKKRQPVLVVAPTTLLFNWKKELEKFAPHLDYFIHHGQRYEDPKELEKHDIILTSYGVVINDIELLQAVPFELIVADESQAIKNAQSLRHKSLVRLKGKLKIALSGTPIENNIGELFAQMNFVNPGFFVSQAAFKRDYVNKFRKEYNQELVSELKHKVAPFILRRTKEEVLPELPDKTEEYLYCEMAPVQRKIYDAHRNEYRDFLLKKFEEEGADNSKMYVLEGLTRLRQICDATALVPHKETRQEAVKIDLLISHITEKTGKHKILVFSQFVKMLALVEKELQRNGIPYSYLDGQTSLKEREARVNRFQEEEEVRVFLVSLKAGGTGLNLTAADYVYILDPWWNPATENQAIDRCYRMGQKKNVFAYRMICKDTVEEKIIELQEAKKKVSRDIIGEGDSILASLDKERLLALFE
jgi:SNF2 family DNA or RNA helicase